MLTIRKEQMEALSEHMLDSFRKRLAEHLRQKLPAHTELMDAPTLEATINAGIERAGRCGVTGENDIRRFVECMFVHGPHFDTDPAAAWAGDILRTDGLSGTEKMDRIEAHAAVEDPT
jgi:hypothetical protein